MNPRIKQLWINALLSGNYRQTTGKLKRTDGFCCLGVLTDLYIQEHNSSWENSCTWEESCGGYSYFMNNSESLPETVAKWADLNEDTACLMSDMNDSGDDFPEIVKFIQLNL